MLRITHVKFRILTKFFEKYIFNLGQTMNAKSAVKNTLKALGPKKVAFLVHF